MNIDLAKIKKVHFIGIGGIGISAIARMMQVQGKEVSANDLDEFGTVAELRKIGIDTHIGVETVCIPVDVDLVVYSIAWDTLGPDLLAYARTLGVPVLSYPEMLEVVTKGKNTIAISGTHGKTTTTAMIAKVLMDTGNDPTVIVGSLLKDVKSNFISGKSGYFVVEACEYRRSFLHIHPKVLIITNIEADHLDYYKDLVDIQVAFGELVAQVDPDGVLVCNPNDPNVKLIAENAKCKVIDYTQYIENLPKLAVPGEHNRMDAAAAYAVAEYLSLDKTRADNALVDFQGTWRRLEKRGVSKNGTIIYDDYAHHPTEIEASLKALRELYPKGEKKIIIVFHPHLYSRTKSLWDGFVSAFDLADEVYILPIYAAREAFDPEVSPEKLADAIKARNNHAGAFRDFDEAIAYFDKANLGSDDILVTMGAGEAYKVADGLLNK